MALRSSVGDQQIEVLAKPAEVHGRIGLDSRFSRD
jgi:hypothetical protein